MVVKSPLHGLLLADEGEAGPQVQAEVGHGGMVSVYYEDEAAWVRWPHEISSTFLPSLFRALVEWEDVSPYAVELDLAVEQASVVCRALTVHRFRRHHRVMQFPRMKEPQHSIVRTFETDVTSEGLRRVRTSSVVRLAVATACHREAGPEGARRRYEHVGLDEWDRLFAAPTPETGRPALDDDHYRQVAEVYRAAFAADLAPTRAVAARFNVAGSTAGRWVMEARRRKFLGSTEKGRPGESRPPRRTKSTRRGESR